MIKRLHRSIKLFLLMFVTFLLVTACYGKTKNSVSPKIQLAASECRVIQHQLGKACVPINPQRLIVTDEITLDAVLALGLKPIAVAEPKYVSSKARLFAGKIKGITSIGKDAQLNIEKIVQLHPDLILGFAGVGINAQNYNLFSQIAPTVTLKNVQTAWKDTFQLVGEILSKSEQAKQLLAQYQQRVEKLRTVIEQLGKTEVSLSRFYGGWQTTEFRTKFSFPGSILAEVGLSIPVAQRQLTHADVPFVQVNLESLELLDADILFVAVDPGAKETFKKYQTSQLWQLLNVVKKKHVYTVDSGYWVFGNILSANAILDDLFKHLHKN